MRWLAILLVAACYRPSPPEGAPCANGTDCPAPLVCDRGRCVSEPFEDAGIDDAQVDAPDAPVGPLTCVQRWQLGMVTTALAPITALNSTLIDINPSVTPDGQTLYFSSNRDGNQDIYRATRSGTTFTNISVVPDLNSLSEEGGVAISANGLTAIVSTDRTAVGAPAGRNFWQATRDTTADAFTNFTTAPFADINTDGNEYEVWMSNDMLRLYVSTSGNGDQTIALSTRNSAADAFSAPIAIPELTSTGVECCHALTTDELLVTFVSNRSGARRVYYATRATRMAGFSTPQLVPGITTMNVDLHTGLSPDGCTLYVVSTRTGGSGSFDLWSTGIGN